jgi:hypothetical protein
MRRDLSVYDSDHRRDDSKTKGLTMRQQLEVIVKLNEDC